MSDQASRKWISETLSSLPEKTRNKKLVGDLRKFAEMSERARDNLTIAIHGSTRVKVVFPSAHVAILADKLSNAKKKARGCLRELSQNIDAVSKASFDNRMIELKDHASSSVKPVLEAWQKLIEDAIGPYAKLADIVSERHLTGGDALTSSLRELRAACTQTPPSDQAAVAVKALIDNMPKILRSLGLSEAVGTFIVAVAEGVGPVRGLENVEVREFLDRHDMWNTLRVSFGGSR